jgi:hypothetical protein
VPTQAIAPWLTGLQVVALLATADVECVAEYLRRQGEKRVSRKLAPTLPACDADDRQPPPLTPAQRLETFQGELWAWGGPSLHVLTMQCGDGALVDHALDILNRWAPRLHCIDEHGNPIASQLLTTHCIKEHPEDSGFLRLVLLGNEHRGGPIPSFRTADVLAFIREFLAADPRFRAVVDVANRLPASASEKGGECELSSPDVALPGAETVPHSTAEVARIAQEPKTPIPAPEEDMQTPATVVDVAQHDHMEPPSGTHTLAPAPERRTGRRPKWNWDGAKAAFAAYLALDPDGLPQIQADAERWVADWFANSNNGDSPPMQEIRSRVVAPVYGAARSTNAAP